jgi:hypothetical protein
LRRRSDVTGCAVRKGLRLMVWDKQTPAAAGTPWRLTDLLTRRCGTVETTRVVGDSHCPDCLVSETHRDAGDGGDVRRGAHNPEVAGSNPAPATNFRRSRPFPRRERAFAFLDAVAERVAATGFRPTWRRDGRDGAARDETAWTWWTLPPAIAGVPSPEVSSAHRRPRWPA